MEKDAVTLGNTPKDWVPYITPECGNCAHAEAKRGIFPLRLCALDKGTKHARYACENFTPSQVVKWLAWE